MSLEQQGFEIRKNLIPTEMLQRVLNELENYDWTSNKHGVRHADKKLMSVKAIVSHPEILKVASDILQGEAQLVRTIVFDKTPEANWLVNWHQDKTIAVSNKILLEGWGPWSVKEGIHHVQPPLSVVEKMITFRIHLDPADETNGCLRVIPASHKMGIVKQSFIRKMTVKQDGVSCIGDRGDTLIMRPHLLHASSKATKGVHRRVIHIEFSTYQLPEGISWA